MSWVIYSFTSSSSSSSSPPTTAAATVISLCMYVVVGSDSASYQSRAEDAHDLLTYLPTYLLRSTVVPTDSSSLSSGRRELPLGKYYCPLDTYLLG